MLVSGVRKEPRKLPTLGEQVFTVTEQLPKKFPEDLTDLNFVGVVADDSSIPRIGESLIIQAVTFKVIDVEYNYDVRHVYVIVTRKTDYSEE